MRGEVGKISARLDKEQGKDAHLRKHSCEFGILASLVEQLHTVVGMVDGCISIAPQELYADEEDADEQHKIHVRGGIFDKPLDGLIIVEYGKPIHRCYPGYAGVKVLEE